MKPSMIPCFLALMALPILTLAEDKIAYSEVLRHATPEQPICFGREYSAKHLESHPGQLVSLIRAKVVKDPTAVADYNYIEINAVLKGEKNFFKLYRAYLVCNAEGECAVECDGGKIKVAGFKDGSLEIRNEGFVLEGGCGAAPKSKAVVLKPTRNGDDVFHLERLPNSFCQL
jgi:hypothetical protein